MPLSDKPFAFWVSHPTATDAPAKGAVLKYLSPCCSLLGLIGFVAACVMPLMLVINSQNLDTDDTISTYNGVYLGCVDFPAGFNQQDKCKFRLFPEKPPQEVLSLPACRIGTPRSGFTIGKAYDTAMASNALFLVSAGFFVLTLIGIALRGTGVLRSGLLPFVLSFLCGLSGTLAIVLWYVFTNPCTKDQCTILNDMSTSTLVTCWALSPVGMVCAMLMNFFAGAMAQRWAPNPEAEAALANEEPMNATGDYIQYPQKA